MKGFCECGCEELTPVATHTNWRRGNIKGQPTRFLTGHGTRKRGLPFRVNEETGCWEWIRCLLRSGYGQVTLNYKKYLAHRVFYLMFKGQIPKGKQIDHLCRNRACVRPNHLEIVSAAENKRRGKGVKLNMQIVRLVRRQIGANRQRGDLSRIGKQFGISVKQMWKIATNQTWREN